MSDLSQATPSESSGMYPTTLTTDIVLRNEELGALRAEWNELLLRSRACTVFLTWEWVEAWWEVYGNKSRHLFLITVRDHAGKLVGIAPFYRESRKVFGCFSIRIVRFLGMGGDVAPNYLDIISDQGMEQEIVRVVVDRLERACSLWDLLELADIPEESPTLSSVEKTTKQYGWRLEKELHSICPYVSLPKKWDDYLKTRSGNFQKKIRQYFRVMARDFTVDFHRVESSAELAVRMESLKALHHDRWNGQSRSFQSGAYIKFHNIVARRFLENGWLRLYFLIVGGQEVAALYCYSFAGVMSFYQSGRSREWNRFNVGDVILAEAIEDAIEEKLDEFDFLRGTDPYKFRWTDQHRKNHLLRSARSSFRAQCFLFQTVIVRRAAKRFLPPWLVEWTKSLLRTRP